MSTATEKPAGALWAFTLSGIAALAFFSAFFKIHSPDFWWHLANGAYALQERTIHFADPWSFTTGGKSYPPTQWGFEVVIASLHRLFGLAGPIVAKAVLVTAMITGIARTLRREGSGVSLALLLSVAAIYLIRPRFILRPDLITFAMLVLVSGILCDFRRHRFDRLRLLPLIFIVWVQFHSGAIFGLLVLGAVWLGETLTARFLPGSAALDAKERGSLLKWTAFSLVATLINPNHVNYLSFAVGHMEDYGKFSIAELRPLEWGRDNLHIIYMAVVCLFLMFRWRRDPAMPVMLIPLGCAAVRTVRLFPVFLVLSIPFIAESLRAAGVERKNLFRWPLGIAAAALTGLIVFTVSPGRSNDYFQFGVGINRLMAPVAAAEALERISPSGNLFNSNEYGGYLAWRFDGDRKVFTDGRSQLHEETLTYINRHSWQEIREKYGIGHCLVDYYWFRSRLPLEGMDLVWWDDHSLLLVSREEAEARGLPVYSLLYPALPPDVIRRTVDPADAEEELRRAAAEAPEAVLPRLLLSNVLEWAGRIDEAEKFIREAIGINPWRGELHVRRGMLLGRMGKDEEALAELKRGLRSSRGNADGWAGLGRLLFEHKQRGALQHAALGHNQTAERMGLQELGVISGAIGLGTEHIVGHQASLWPQGRGQNAQVLAQGVADHRHRHRVQLRH